jgi:hypothetical protein
VRHASRLGPPQYVQRVEIRRQVVGVDDSLQDLRARDWQYTKLSYSGLYSSRYLGQQICRVRGRRQTRTDVAGRSDAMGVCRPATKPGFGRGILRFRQARLRGTYNR